MSTSHTPTVNDDPLRVSHVYAAINALQAEYSTRVHKLQQSTRAFCSIIDFATEELNWNLFHHHEKEAKTILAQLQPQYPFPTDIEAQVTRSVGQLAGVFHQLDLHLIELVDNAFQRLPDIYTEHNSNPYGHLHLRTESCLDRVLVLHVQVAFFEDIRGKLRERVQTLPGHMRAAYGRLRAQLTLEMDSLQLSLSQIDITTLQPPDSVSQHDLRVVQLKVSNQLSRFDQQLEDLCASLQLNQQVHQHFSTLLTAHDGLPGAQLPYQQMPGAESHFEDILAACDLPEQCREDLISDLDSMIDRVDMILQAIHSAEGVLKAAMERAAQNNLPLASETPATTEPASTPHHSRPAPLLTVPRSQVVEAEAKPKRGKRELSGLKIENPAFAAVCDGRRTRRGNKHARDGSEAAGDDTDTRRRPTKAAKPLKK